MRAFTLNLCPNQANSSVWVAPLGAASSSLQQGLTPQLVRSSPIYSVLAPVPETTPLPLSPECPNILFCFTLDAFKAIGALKKKLPLSIQASTYTSHGLAALILFYEHKTDAQLVLETMAPFTFAHESWIVQEGRLVSASSEITAKAGLYQSLDLWVSEHSTEETVLFAELCNTFQNVNQLACRFVPEYRKQLDPIALLAGEIAASILYLRGRIAASVLDQRLTNLFRDAPAVVQETRETLEKLKANSETCNVAIHQLRDEAVQIAAILQSVFQQGLGGVPPLTHSQFQAGTCSLLGVGGAYAALVALYWQAQAAFFAVRPEQVVRETFPDWPAPGPLSNPQDYENWRANLRNHSKAKNQRAGTTTKNFSHLLYFSNRLGFRATKLSVTAAYQSIFLGSLPSWNLSTLFHELLHAHARALWASILPLEKQPFDTAYELYCQRVANPSKPANLTEFLRTIVLSTVSDLRDVDAHESGVSEGVSIRQALPKDKLYRATSLYYNQIDEVLVHTLDFNYFYRSDADLYVKSVWSSWLTLPFVTRRISEYALRTICALASAKDGQRMERFNWALNKLRTQLGELKSYPFSDSAVIDFVLTFLAKDNHISAMRHRFFVLSSFVDASAEFLVFPSITPLLFHETEDAQQSDDTFSYEITPGEYPDERVESAVAFLMDHLRHGLRPQAALPHPEQGAFDTLWSFQAIASAIKHEQLQKGIL